LVAHGDLARRRPGGHIPLHASAARAVRRTAAVWPIIALNGILDVGGTLSTSLPGKPAASTSRLC